MSEVNYSSKIAAQLNVQPIQVSAVVALLDDGSTVPFISRYRKEATGNLDEVAITSIRDKLSSLRELDKRRATVLTSIKEQGKLTDSLKDKILKVETLTALEDIYLPYRPKRRTKATMAKEKGLEPLAKLIFEQTGIDPQQEAQKYIDAKKEVKDVAAALAGARDIIAEWVNEDAKAREQVRELYNTTAIIRAKVITGKQEEAVKYKDYFDWSESVLTAPSHRILAVRRAEKEQFLTVRISPEEEQAIKILNSLFLKGKGGDSAEVSLAIVDCYKRLMSLSLETEIRMALKKKADIDAIEIFKSNLKQLLMAPALGGKNVLAIDPGFRTGCKVVCLDKEGNLLFNTAIYIGMSEHKQDEAKDVILELCKKYKIEVIAIGNGTASRETDVFVRSLGLDKSIFVVMVSESGASVYSASDVAREEFPDYDVTVRGAVSIGRRLMDPLAELVKIDPKSIGVGQYQHDVDQNLLKRSLDDVVVSCVNNVGVELNTASKELLTYVSGIGPSRAKTIVEHRQQNGRFQTRDALTVISGFSRKIFEQAAGFLRINDGENPLDSSAVHPESYPIVAKMAEDLNVSVDQLIGNESVTNKIKLENYVTEDIGLPTLMDIKTELSKPGRDPREPFELFTFEEGVETMDDLTEGMKLPGIITNITAFGAFVDIGVHQDGLVHISEMADRYVKDPHEVVSVHQKVDVTVLEVDTARKRIALSMRS